jgi:hypothetical protein
MCTKLPSDVVGQLRSLRSRLKIAEALTQQAREDAARYRAERDALVALVNMARDAYIEENSDGETDCVTPYDWYGISIKEGIKP